YPRSISRLRPKPGTFSTKKPCSCNPRRMAPALEKVEKVVPGPDRSAIRRNRVGVQRSGFLAGEKPSRNKASAVKRERENCCCASPSISVRRTRPPARSKRWKPSTAGGYAASSSLAYGASCGQVSRERERSSGASGQRSTEIK